MRSHELVDEIRSIQLNYKDLTLCGSVPLILLGILPDREVGDIDFVTTDMSIAKHLHLGRDPYDNEGENGGYISLSGYRSWRKINLLVFPVGTIINKEIVRIDDIDITMQQVSDILNWKEKYNRTKDIKDLDAIALNMLEKAVFNK